MYRFLLRPRWIGFHLLVIVAIFVMINLGFWQLRRLDQRQEFNDTVDSRYDAPPEQLDDLLGAAGDDLDSIEWRPVSLTGEFTGDGEVHVINRSQHGRAGYNVVMPFQLDGGRIVLVNRGFVPLGSDDDEIARTPDSTVTLTGRVHPSEERQRGQLSDPADGVLAEVQRIDIPRLDEQIDGDLVQVYVDLVEPRPNAYPEPIVEPELTEGPHLGYAIQWFTFSVCVAVGWVLAVRMSKRRRQQAGGVNDDNDLVAV